MLYLVGGTPFYTLKDAKEYCLKWGCYNLIYVLSAIPKHAKSFKELSSVGELKYTLKLVNNKWKKTYANCNAQRFIENIKM